MTIAKSSYYALACNLMILCCACKNSQTDTANRTDEASIEIESKINNVQGTSYSDSMIAVLTKNNEDQIIRSDSEALTLLNCDSTVLQVDYLFNIDSINKYENLISLTTTAPYAEVRGYGCVGQFMEHGDMQASVVFSKMLESHYSSSIDLIVYQNDSLTNHTLKLAQYYANENYERTIESTIKSNSIIVRTIFEELKINSMRNKQAVQKIEKMKTIEWYKIKPNGVVELLSSEMAG